MVGDYEIKRLSEKKNEVNIWVKNVKTNKQGAFTSASLGDLIYNYVKEMTLNIK